MDAEREEMGRRRPCAPAGAPGAEPGPNADPRKWGVLGGPREGKASAARRRRRRRRRRRPAEQEQQRSPCRKEQRRGGAGSTPGSSWAAGPGAGRPGLWASSLAGAPGGDRGRAPFFSMRREPGAVRSAGLATRAGGALQRFLALPGGVGVSYKGSCGSLEWGARRPLLI